MNKEIYKIGLFFGSFNPITQFHIRCAKIALEEAKLDQVNFVLSPLNPDKSESSDIAHYKYRLEMLNLELNQHSNFYVDTSEIQLHEMGNNLCYTYDTIKTIENKQQQIYSQPVKNYLIIGDDVYHNIINWYKGYELIHYPIISIPRESQDYIILSENKIENILKSVKRDHGSSTVVRSEIRKGFFNNLLQYNYISQQVSDYIQQNKLYQN